MGYSPIFIISTLGRAFSAGNDVLFIHLAKMIISWKTNVFSQLSRNPPKIDGLPIILFFSFSDNVFSLKTQKTRFYQKSRKSTENEYIDSNQVFFWRPVSRKTYRTKTLETRKTPPHTLQKSDNTPDLDKQNTEKTHTHKTRNHHAMRHDSWKSSLNTWQPLTGWPKRPKPDCDDCTRGCHRPCSECCFVIRHGARRWRWPVGSHWRPPTATRHA